MTQHVQHVYRRHKKSAWVLLLGLAGLAVTLVPTGHTAKPPSADIKNYTACLQYGTSPSCTSSNQLTVLPGGQSVQLRLTLTNDRRSNQTLGSANLNAPSELPIDRSKPIIVSPPGQEVGLTDSTLELQNLNLAKDTSVTVTFSVTTPCSGTGLQWHVQAKQSNNFLGTGNDFNLQSSTGLTTNVTGCYELRFVTQPANPWEKGSTITPPVEVAVFSGAARVAVDGIPELTATSAGTTTPHFYFGSATYSASTMSWKWLDAMPTSNAPSGLYNLTATLGAAMTDTSDSDAGTDGDQPFRVTSSICEPGETCNLTSDLPGPQVHAGITNTLPGSISIDFETGDDATCEQWNRAFFTNASGDEVNFPGVALDFTWDTKGTLQLVYRIRNSEWVLTQVARGNNDIEICAGAKHGVDTHLNKDEADGGVPFSGKHGKAKWSDGLFWGVLGTVPNPAKVRKDPVVCASGNQSLPTGPNGASETWRTWTICIPKDWDWKNFG